MASEEVRGSFCRYDSCVITDQLATGVGTLERELLAAGVAGRLQRWVRPYSSFDASVNSATVIPAERIRLLNVPWATSL